MEHEVEKPSEEYLQAYPEVNGFGKNQEILPVSPSKEEIATYMYVEKHIGTPSLSNLHPDFGSTITSLWNRKVVVVCCDSFKQIPEVVQIDDTIIKKEFDMQFCNLRARHKHQVKKASKPGN